MATATGETLDGVSATTLWTLRNRAAEAKRHDGVIGDRWNWGQLRHHLTAATGRWRIEADGIEFFRIEKVTVSRYSYRVNKIPTPWPIPNPA